LHTVKVYAEKLETNTGSGINYMHVTIVK